jgi:hypothetical protein
MTSSSGDCGVGMVGHVAKVPALLQLHPPQNPKLPGSALRAAVDVLSGSQQQRLDTATETCLDELTLYGKTGHSHWTTPARALLAAFVTRRSATEFMNRFSSN